MSIAPHNINPLRWVRLYWISFIAAFIVFLFCITKICHPVRVTNHPADRFDNVPRSPDGPSERAARDALVVLDGASDLHQSVAGSGIMCVSYSIDEDYPASAAIQKLSEQLENAGWRPLLVDWLNPGISSSHVRGWIDYLDSGQTPPRHVYLWLSQWEDHSGCIVRFALRYSTHYDDTTNPHTVSVEGVYYSSQAAKVVRATTQPK